MKRIQIIFAFLFLTFVLSCQKNDATIFPSEGAASHKANAQLAITAEPAYYSVSYTKHLSVTVDQYLKRARLSGINNQGFGSLTLQQVVQYSSTGATIQKEKATTLLQALNGSYPISIPYSSTNCIIYRGGGVINPNLQYKTYTNTQGIVMVVGVTTSNTTGLKAGGPSFNVNPNNTNIINNGGAYKIKSAIPSDLTFIQQGQDVGHFVLVPKNDMLVATYLSRIAQVNQLQQAF